MKKKPRGQNFEIIKKYLEKQGVAHASAIQKATKIKGNIYTTLQTMLNRNEVVKMGMLYKLTGYNDKKYKMIVDEVKSELVHQQPQPQPQPTSNPYANILKREHEHIMQGIQQLQITANYINLRIRELERANQTS